MSEKIIQNRHLAFQKYVFRLGINEMMKYCLSSAKLILRILETYLTNYPLEKLSSFKDEFALVVADIDAFEKGDLTKAAEIRRRHEKLLQIAEPFQVEYAPLFYRDIIASTVCYFMRAVSSIMDGPASTPYLEQNYMGYIYKLTDFCRRYNKWKRNMQLKYNNGN